MIAHWETKLEENVLDKDTTATAYINNFEMYVRKLKLLNETWDEDKRVREFKKRVEDPDYDTEIHVHKDSFNDMITEIRKREQELDRVARESSKKNKRTRRVVFENDGSSDENDGSKKEKISSGIKPEINLAERGLQAFCPNFCIIHLMIQ